MFQHDHGGKFDFLLLCTLKFLGTHVVYIWHLIKNANMMLSCHLFHLLLIPYESNEICDQQEMSK